MNGSQGERGLHGAAVFAAGDLEEARGRLEAVLGGLGRTLVAYSGGVDSSLLLAEAHRVLGGDVTGVVADSPSLPRAELAQAVAFARERGIAIDVVPTRELDLGAYRANGPDRCFHCKAELFGRLEAMAGAVGAATLAYGAVTDDLADVRPGMRAAERFRVRAPLLEAAFSKLLVRALARKLALPVWDKPQAACLASRIPRGVEVTRERLARVEEAEAWLREVHGLRILRVRHHGEEARIEVDPAEVQRISAAGTLSAISRKLKALGFASVWIDPAGYRRSDPLPSAERGN